MDKGFHVVATDDEIRKKPDAIQPILPSFGSFNSGWIKCSYAMPPEQQEVLVFTNHKHILHAHLDNKEPEIWTGYNLDMDNSELMAENPTYWMPLPKPPEEETWENTKNWEKSY